MTEPLQDALPLLRRGCEKIYSESELREKLARSAASGRPLRIKLGLDPTAPDIHLGHTVVLRKMKQFQDLGHKAVLIIGDYTARIGDPSGRSKTRPMLDDTQIKNNAETYFHQAARVLEHDPEKLEIRYNSEWLASFTFEDVLRLAAKVTVPRMLERDAFADRLEHGQELYVHELFYPLMQAYDSVQIKADVELGGTDQTFNNLMGRDLQQGAGQERQVVMVMPLLVGLDGREKMSKSLGNYIGLTDPANEMFAKVMSIPDTLMASYYTLLTDKSEDEVKQILAGNPRSAKAQLAGCVVAQYHDEAAAQSAGREFDRVFVHKDKPSDIPVVAIAEKILDDGQVGLLKLIVHCGFAGSNSEARRLVLQGGVRLDEEVIKDPTGIVTPQEGMIVQVGKRKFASLTLEVKS